MRRAAGRRDSTRDDVPSAPRYSTTPKRRLLPEARLSPVILENGWIVTMDDGGSEYPRGWLQIEDGLIAAVGEGDPPERGQDVKGAVVTPGLVNTHHHLYQALTRGYYADPD